MNTKQLTGYPSIDKPWLKYYSDEAINAPLPECTLYEYLYENNKDYPNDIALNYYDRQFTYGELFMQIEKTAKAFSALGVHQGDTVIVCSVNMPETVYTIYALNHLGAIINLVDPRTNEENLRTYINECNACIVLTVDLAYPIIKKAVNGSTAKTVLVVSPGNSLPAVKKLFYRVKNKPMNLDSNTMYWNDFIEKGKGANPNYPKYKKDNCCIIAHTGGTTGLPKGVMLSNDNLNAVAHSYQYLKIPFQRQDRYFDDLPPFIIYGLTLAIHIALSYGQEIILYPVFDSKNFPKLFVKYKPNHFSALADHLTYLCAESSVEDLNLSFLISAGVGGDSLNTKCEESVNLFLKEHGCKYEVIKGYGMTELAATSIISFEKANAIGSIGIPLIINTAKIVNTDTEKELPYNQIGEIWISGPSIMLGYYNMPKETAEIIFTDADGKRWIRTGDLGRMNENGLLFHEGRIRRIYLTAFDGQPAKIFPLPVENAIKESSDVHDCTVVGRVMKNSAYYESVAFVVLKSTDKSEALLTKELSAICAEKVPSYMCPVEYRFVPEFPHTPIGKVDFRALEKMAKENPTK